MAIHSDTPQTFLACLIFNVTVFR